MLGGILLEGLLFNESAILEIVFLEKTGECIVVLLHGVEEVGQHLVDLEVLLIRNIFSS